MSHLCGGLAVPLLTNFDTLANNHVAEREMESEFF